MKNNEESSSQVTSLTETASTFVIRRGKLVVISGPDKGREIVVGQQDITIGKKKDNKFILTDTSISRHHVLVKETHGGFLLKDLKSTNGTFLNDVKIHEAYLKFGTIIKIGHSKIKFIPYDDSIKSYPSEKPNFGDCYSDSFQMRNIFTMLERIAKTDATIILEGETGTGKELLARAIHKNSSRSKKPFLVLDCSAIAKNLIESELFGHEKGAFTGANTSRKGVFEEANFGTVFIDEIGELSQELQPRLLRVLENRELKRVGGNRIVKINVRVIAATNRNLADEVKHNRFREDLYFRLSVLRIHIPPLRERKDDITPITKQLIKSLAKDYELHTPPKILSSTLDILRSHDWPGNIRELKNVLNRAMAMGNNKEIKPADLLLTSSYNKQTDPMKTPLAGLSLEEVEKIAILATLKKHKGNKTKAAKDLGIAYSTLYEKMKKFGI